MCRSILSLKWHIKCVVITHSAKETRKQKEQWGWGLEMTGKWSWREGGIQHLKKRRGVGNIGGLVPLCQLCEDALKIFHSPHYKTNPPIPGLLPPPLQPFLKIVIIIITIISNNICHCYFKFLKPRNQVSDQLYNTKITKMTVTKAKYHFPTVIERLYYEEYFYSNYL